jgi:hypothetical protein
MINFGLINESKTKAIENNKKPKEIILDFIVLNFLSIFF